VAANVINVGQFEYTTVLPLIASPFLALQDADDWSAPERLNQLLLGIYRWRCDVIGSSVMRIRAGSEPELMARPSMSLGVTFRYKAGAFLTAQPCFAERSSSVLSVARRNQPRLAGTLTLFIRGVFRLGEESFRSTVLLQRAARVSDPKRLVQGSKARCAKLTHRS